jgi:cytoskeletal protein CcmA (bactofilin family)
MLFAPCFVGKEESMSREKSFFAKSSEKPSSAPEEISAFLGKETFFEGKMTFEGVFRLEGRFGGEIFESGTLIVGETAAVKGKIGVNTIIINGLVEGEVYAKERVEIDSTGKFCGSLFTPALVIKEGGILDGHCRMQQTFDKEENDLQHLSQEADHHLTS